MLQPGEVTPGDDRKVQCRYRCHMRHCINRNVTTVVRFEKTAWDEGINDDAQLCAADVEFN